jgi:hypothetical protein
MPAHGCARDSLAHTEIAARVTEDAEIAARVTEDAEQGLEYVELFDLFYFLFYFFFSFLCGAFLQWLRSAHACVKRCLTHQKA